MPGSSLEHLSDAFASLGTALDISLSPDFLSDSETLGPRDWSLVHSSQILHRFGVVSEIFFASDKDDGQTLAEVKHLGDPLQGSGKLAHVCSLPFLERCRASRVSRSQSRQG